MLLIDTVVVAFANAMRLQSIIGNAALLIEAEMSGQPSLRASWKTLAEAVARYQGTGS